MGDLLHLGQVGSRRGVVSESCPERLLVNTPHVSEGRCAVRGGLLWLFAAAFTNAELARHNVRHGKCMLHFWPFKND